MKVLTTWLRAYLPDLHASDPDLAEALTLRGIAVEGVFDLTPQHGALLGKDAGSLFEMDITTNRVDAMNHYGIAREAAVIYGLQLQPLDLSLHSPNSAQNEAHADEPAFPVRIDPGAQALCGRFTARVLRGITIEPSQGIVAERFRLLGQKQISNAVDATNYVTQAIGQPTHAFDLDRLEGGIVVRRAHAGERLKTLDGVERTLHPDDLVIADERKALSLAGVMGGWDSMITAATRNVLIEAAWFDPASIRRSSKRHGLHTDASHRFERGADFNAAPVASALVSRILLQSGGFVPGPFVDVQQPAAVARTVGRSAVSLHMREVHRILGPTETPGDISGSEATTILMGLGCAVAADPGAGPSGAQAALHGAFATHDLAHGTGLQIASAAPAFPPVTQEVPITAPAPEVPSAGEPQKASPNPARAHESAATTEQAVPAAPPDADQRFEITLPSWRLDLEREIDLIEEIARVYGYNRFRNTLPAFTGSVRELPEAAALRTVRRVLRGVGWSEAISSTFVSQVDAEAFAAQPGTAVSVGNPLSEEAGMLRPSLVPGMLAMLAQNLKRGVDDVALFELGTVFTGSGPSATDRVDERLSLTFGATGALGRAPVDFFTAKGITEAIAHQFTARLQYIDRFPPELGLMPAWLHPGRSARFVLDGSTIGFFGQVHPQAAAARKLRQAVVLGELRLDRLLALGLRHPMPREVSRFQPVRRDFSFLLPARVSYGQVASALEALGIAEIQRFEPVEVRPVEGTGANEEEYSLLLRTLFQSSERTLRDEELQAWAQAMEAAVAALGGRLRS